MRVFECMQKKTKKRTILKITQGLSPKSKKNNTITACKPERFRYPRSIKTKMQEISKLTFKNPTKSYLLHNTVRLYCTLRNHQNHKIKLQNQ